MKYDFEQLSCIDGDLSANAARRLGGEGFEGDKLDLVRTLQELDNENGKLKISNASLTGMLASALQRIAELETKIDNKEEPASTNSQTNGEEEAQERENSKKEVKSKDDTKDLCPLFLIMWISMYLFYLLFVC